MVYRGNIDAETKAYAGFFRQQSDLTVQEIVHPCGISRASVYRCLNTNTCDKNRQSRGRPRLLTSEKYTILGAK